MNSTNKSEVVYFDNLDGLRFFAFLIVFISHAVLFLGYQNTSNVFSFLKNYILTNGDIGVSFFFVLSGFLITHLLLKEKDRNGNISLKKFYTRRILRIWPVYFITLIVGFFILPPVVHFFIGGEVLPFLTDPPLSALPQYLFFLANFHLAFHGGASVPTDVLWSISVEEQFYLIWPWVISFIPRKHLPKILGVIVLVSCLYRYFYAFSPDVLAYSTFSVMSYLAIGSLLAWFVSTKNHIVDYLRQTPKFFIFLVYLFLAILVFGRHYVADILYSQKILFISFVTFLPLILASVFAFIIFEQNEFFKSIFKTGKSKILTFLGRISYGFYSYHMFAFTIVLLIAFRLGMTLNYSSTLEWFIFIGLSFVTVFVIASISYYMMEKQFLKRKPKN